MGRGLEETGRLVATESKSEVSSLDPQGVPCVPLSRVNVRSVVYAVPVFHLSTCQYHQTPFDLFGFYLLLLCFFVVGFVFNLFAFVVGSLS